MNKLQVAFGKHFPQAVRVNFQWRKKGARDVPQFLKKLDRIQRVSARSTLRFR